MTPIDHDWLQRARRLHDRCLVLDTHCDTTQRLLDPNWDFSVRHEDGHVDIPRLREGGVDGLFLAVWAPGSNEPGADIASARAQIGRIHDTVRHHAGDLALARTAEDVRHARAEGRIAVLIAVEGGYLIEDSLEILREYHRGGATYLTLTHAFHTSWADSSGVHEPLGPRHGGLTAFGKEVVKELNRIGMMVDVSHVSDRTFWDVVGAASAPIIATHSSCRAVSPHCRNLSDEMILAIADSGGVVQINFAAGFIDPDAPPIPPDVLKEWAASGSPMRRPIGNHVTPLSVLVDHVDHALQLVGPAHVGIGSDFDGVPILPADMEDCSKLPNLTAQLLKRGYSDEELSQVLGENILRVMGACSETARGTPSGDGPGAAEQRGLTDE